jgi:hypothetical protein
MVLDHEFGTCYSAAAAPMEKTRTYNTPAAGGYEITFRPEEAIYIASTMSIMDTDAIPLLASIFMDNGKSPPAISIIWHANREMIVRRSAIVVVLRPPIPRGLADGSLLRYRWWQLLQQ